MEHQRNETYKKDLMKGKVCFMAGATSGINRQIAIRFAMEGAKVFVVSRSQAKVDDTVSELKALGAQAAGQSVDVREYDTLQAAVMECVTAFGKIDMVLAGQAGNFLAGAAQMSANAFKSVIDIDILGSFNVFHACVSHLSEVGASLIAISAPQATAPMCFQSHVCTAKAGVNMMVKCLAMEWGASGVRVNAITPGPIEGTEGMDRLAGSKEMATKYKQAVALRTFGSKDMIADAALWLCSDAARYVTGTILEVDGGMSLGDASTALKI